MNKKSYPALTAEDIIEKISMPLFGQLDESLEALDDLLEVYVMEENWTPEHRHYTWSLYRGIKNFLIDLQKYQNQKGGKDE